MQVICYRAVRTFNEFLKFKKLLLKRYPSYEHVLLDEINIEGSFAREEISALSVFIIEHGLAGRGVVGFMNVESAFSDYALFDACQSITKTQFQEIIDFKNIYTFQSKKRNSFFRLDLEMTLREQNYARYN